MVVEVGNWRTHNRNSKRPWGPVNGSIVHHTVTKGTASTVAIVRDGYSSLPGPLCHGMIAKDGRVHMVGWGRANHAGGGDPGVLDQVIAESYGSGPTAPTKGNANGTDGNARFYGWECENLGDGKDPISSSARDGLGPRLRSAWLWLSWPACRCGGRPRPRSFCPRRRAG
ncbi:N-acetylmuramoyl-L-alanine amidase [Streptomyces sp. NPDC014744]|uniref:peptidoglycan recognition protein family protein n=1 Tax=Streptomyces sp. NPDC014744 TaxID=3364903 RepID=UPI0036FA3586